MADITILDGGMGKELRRIGAPFRQPEWSALALMEAPDTVVAAHDGFIDAGADVIITNNYAIVPFHLGDQRFDAIGVGLADLAGRLAREAADGVDRSVAVAGSLPPLFGSYEPDLFDPDRAAPMYDAIIAALAPHVDMWIIETASSTAEIRSVHAAVGRHVADGTNPPIPLWVSVNVPDDLDLDGQGSPVPVIRNGESIDDLVATIVELRSRSGLAGPIDAVPVDAVPIDAVMVNCSMPENTGPALRSIRAGLDARSFTQIRTGGYANAFPRRTDDQRDERANTLIHERRGDITAARYADIVAGWIDDGATIVGGCCDMYPEHIAALTERFGSR